MTTEPQHPAPAPARDWTARRGWSALGAILAAASWVAVIAVLVYLVGDVPAIAVP